MGILQLPGFIHCKFLVVFLEVQLVSILQGKKQWPKTQSRYNFFAAVAEWRFMHFFYPLNYYHDLWRCQPSGWKALPCTVQLISAAPAANRKRGSCEPGTSSRFALLQTYPHNGGWHLWHCAPKHYSGDHLSPQHTNQLPKSFRPFGQPHFLNWKQVITPSYTHYHPQHPAEHEAQHQPLSGPFFIVPSSCCTFLLTPCCCLSSATPRLFLFFAHSLPLPIPVSC